MSANCKATTDRALERIKARGFKLSCPVCGEAKPTISLALDDLATCTCDSCDDSFAVHTALKILADRLAEWQRLASWIDLAGSPAAPPSESE